MSRRPRPATPPRAPVQPGQIVFMRQQNYDALWDRSPNRAIPITGALTVERMINELRQRRDVWGMRELVVQPDLPIIDLLAQAPRLFRDLCPMLAPSGTLVCIAFEGPGWTSWLQRIRQICPHAILHR
ncbi:hypothetical protein [Bradyrhizobium prioriisuperbiae]|uniref:hypothetical protein n=1 Tax=Bradyrhizobium prioriisuperbiae TaxID=2854389 RepID=UPI0028E274B0|nr:hypothetical protein [Bradyrhizobium prioritasuperba]